MKAMGKLSASEKEKTKIRERNRRSITTKIFQGLRKYGGYNLAPRADINEVLRCLAAEAGWTVEEDGTTYRSQAPSGAQALLQVSSRAGRASFSGGSMSGFSGLIGSASDGGGLQGAGSGALVSSGGGILSGGIGGGFMSAGSGLFSLQPVDLSGYLEARGGDCSTTASPRRQAATNSGSFFSAHPTTVTPTPTSSISFVPSVSPFASPASSEVYPSSSRSTTTLAPPPLSTSATATALYSTWPFPSSVNYTGCYSAIVGDGGAPPTDLKDDLLNALPLDFCTSAVQSHYQNCLAAAAMAARRRGHQQLLLEQQQQELQRPSAASIFNAARLSAARGASIPPLMMLSQHQVHPFLQEARASNHSTPLGSPQHHG